MPTVVAHHDVTDTDHWLSSTRRQEFFAPLGITSVKTFVDPQNRNHVGLVVEAPDLDALLAALETEDAAAAMQADGVLPDTLTLLVEA